MSFQQIGVGIAVTLKPFLPEIEAENPEFTFILIDRDAYMDLAKALSGTQVCVVSGKG